MTITITLPPATEGLLRAEAEATGKEIAELVVEAVEARLSLAQLPLRAILRPVHEDFRNGGMAETELDQLLETALSDARANRATDPGASS